MIFLTQFVGNDFAAGFLGDEDQYAALAAEANKVFRQPKVFLIFDVFNIFVSDEDHHLCDVFCGFSHVALDDLDWVREHVSRKFLNPFLERGTEHETLAVGSNVVAY